MTYTLIDYGTGEAYTIHGEGVTCQRLYKRALSLRREAACYHYPISKMKLIKNYDFERITEGTLIQEWTGGIDTPIEDLRLSVRNYWTLKKRRLDTVEAVLEYIRTADIFRRLPYKSIYKLAEALKPYDADAVNRLVRRVNQRREKKPL